MCYNCNGATSTQCLKNSCAKGSYPLIETPTTCIYQCIGSKLFFDHKTNKCHKCQGFCEICFGITANSCVKCIPGYVLSGTTCTTNCPEHKFSKDGACNECSAGCNNCIEKSTHCVDGCADTFYEKGDECVKECGNGMNIFGNMCKSTIFLFILLLN